MAVVELSFLAIVTRLIAGATLATVLGLAMTAAARTLGDPGPAHDGRLTASPFRQVDLWSLAAAVFTLTGWTRTLDFGRTRETWWRPAVAGLISLLAVLAVGTALSFAAPRLVGIAPASMAMFVAALIATTAQATLSFVAINLIPLPPLAAGYALQSMWPEAFDLVRPHVTAISAALLLISALVHHLYSPLPLAQVLSWT